MFRRLLRHLQGEIYGILKTIVLFYDTDLKLCYAWVYNNNNNNNNTRCVSIYLDHPQGVTEHHYSLYKTTDG